MRKILILCGFTLVALTALAVWYFRAPGHYGQPMTGAPRVELAELLANPGGFKDRTISLAGTVYRQCPVTGCWFYFKTPDGHELRIELGDTVAGLPRRIGASALVEGRLVAQGDTHIFVGTGVDFGPAATAPAPTTDDAVRAAAQASKPLGDGYPIDFCIVGGEKLGSMGEPYVHKHGERTVKFCCKSCISSFQKDPARFLKVLDDASAQKNGQPAR